MSIFLAEQMGTSVKMIEDHYGHVNTIKHADRVLMGTVGWETVADLSDTVEDNAKASKGASSRDKAARPAQPRRSRGQNQRPSKH